MKIQEFCLYLTYTFSIDYFYDERIYDFTKYHCYNIIYIIAYMWLIIIGKYICVYI